MSTHGLSTNEAAAKLEMHPLTLAQWRKKNQGPDFFKIGGRIYYKPEDIEKYVSGCRVRNASIKG